MRLADGVQFGITEQVEFMLKQKLGTRASVRARGEGRGFAARWNIQGGGFTTPKKNTGAAAVAPARSC